MTPDFAFGKVGANGVTEYSIVIESAFSQSPESLETKAAKHLMRPEVACVIGLDFETAAFNSPAPSSTRVPAMTFQDFTAAAEVVSHLGPIKLGPTTWTPRIERIQLMIWFKKPGTNITPINNGTQHNDLVERHSDILDFIKIISRGVIGKSTFKSIYPDQNSFHIDWQGFYGDLYTRLSTETAKRRVAELYPDSDDEGRAGDAGTDGNTPPVPKRVKTDTWIADLKIRAQTTFFPAAFPASAIRCTPNGAAGTSRNQYSNLACPVGGGLPGWEGGGCGIRWEIYSRGRVSRVSCGGHGETKRWNIGKTRREAAGEV
ncbi:hypothetical protein C8R44DRAFT_753160 [Mycena epipterygia]|nr:hypothetical protein C8R44DRAFT_753160 [Mycena epipterygia]